MSKKFAIRTVGAGALAAVATLAVVVLPSSIASAGKTKPPSVATCTGMLGQETSLILTGCTGSSKISPDGLGVTNLGASTAVVYWTNKKYTNFSFTETAVNTDACPTLGGDLPPAGEASETATVTGGNTKLTLESNSSDVCIYSISGFPVGDGDGVMETNLPGHSFIF